MEPEDVTFQFLREITDDFSKENKIGEGAFGVVYKGVTRNGEDVAVKKLKLCDANLNDKQFQTELNNLRKLEHQNIVRILGYCYDTQTRPFNMPDGSKVYLEETQRALCFEYLDNGSLQKYLSDELCGLDWHIQFKIIKGICEGLKYIHHELKPPIYHLDLKPDNILLAKDMVPKIADFGLSRIFDKEQKRTTPNLYGTLGYQPPEYIDKGEISGKFDIFSLDVIIIRIVSGSNGYPKCLDMPSDEFIDQVQNNWRNRLQTTFHSNSLLEAYCHQIVICTQIALKCVDQDSQKRPNIVTIIEKLNEVEIHVGKKQYHNTGFGLTMHNKKTQRTNESKDITSRQQNTNLMAGPSCSELDVVDEREKSTDVIEELIVGRTEEKMKIMDILHGVMSEKIVILPIYGIGGIGKTTFARLIYNDQNFKQYSHVWVDVSLKFDLNKIIRSIILQLSGKENQDNDIQIIHSCLTKLLASKKIMVVLDDLWEDDQLQLQELKNMLYHDTSKIIVLVTTRSERVAGRMCANLQSYKILPLTNDMCWDIIKQRSGFEDRDDKQQLMGIGLEIAQKCGGVPLAAQSLGFTLRSMNFDQWKDVKASGIWNEPISNEISLPNHALASLKLSYSYMDPCLKTCFAYCAIFPKGHKIVKNDLVYQWMSLGFIKPTKLLSNIQLSEKCIVQLLGLSFFQNLQSAKNVEVYHENVTVFTMHDLVHDLARSVMVDGALDVGKQGNTGGNRCLSVLLSDSTKSLQSFTQCPSQISAMRATECEKIVLYGASTSSPEYLPFLLCGQTGIHEDVFSFAHYLRVLDLSEYSIHKLPNSIGDLKQLRYLSVPMVHQVTADNITKLSMLIYLSLCRSYSILTLSESIGEMEGLMYLDLSGCYLIEELPQSLGKLKELVHLDLSRCSRVTNISESLERLTKLEYLNLSYCSNIGDLPKHLGSLLKLRNLDLSYSSYIDGRANVAILVTLTKLECLNLASHLSSLENLPEALGRLTNLKYLNLSCADRYSLGMDHEIRVRNLKNLLERKGVHGMLEFWGSLTKLQYLNLSGFSCYFGANVNLQMISEAMGRNLDEPDYLNWRAGEAFDTFLECLSKLPSLEHLDLSCNDNLMTVPRCLGNLCKLHTLNLSGCRGLKMLPENLYEMDSLRFLDLTGCHNLRKPNQHRLNKSLLTLPHFPVQSDCHDSSSNLILLRDVNRTDLVISGLENVKSVQEARSINLKGKSKMTELELNWTKDVERSVEDMEVLGELVPPRNLKYLKIDGYNSNRFPKWFAGSSSAANHFLSSANHFPEWSAANHFPFLISVSMSGLPKCYSLPPFDQLPYLKCLVLERMNGISEIHWDCRKRRAFPSLESLTLREMESLKKVLSMSCPDCGQYSSRSFVLEISDCPYLRLEPCSLGASWYLRRIHGRSDGVISSWREGASQTSVSSSSVLVTSLFVSVGSVSSQPRMLDHLGDLTSLTINECINLSSFPRIIQALSSLRTLQVRELPDWLGQLASLEHLTVRCQEVVTDKSKRPDFGFPDLTSLRSLCLSEFKSLTQLGPWVGSLVSLQRLEILSCQNLNDLAESFEYLNSLKELKISMCDSITSLPDSIGCLTSLTKLRTSQCDGITSLTESIQQLTQLKRLDILECKELEKWCETEENKDKLAHIKEKTINDWTQFL